MKKILLFVLIIVMCAFSQNVYEPAYKTIKGRNGVITEHFATYNVAKLGYKITNGTFDIKTLKVDYNPFAGRLKIDGPYSLTGERISLKVYDSYNMWIGTSINTYEINYNHIEVFPVSANYTRQIHTFQISLINSDKWKTDVVCYDNTSLFVYENNLKHYYCLHDVPTDYYIDTLRSNEHTWFNETVSVLRKIPICKRTQWYDVSTHTCIDKVVCQADELYDISDNSCMEKPENSHWTDTSAFEYECDSTYIYFDEHCVEKSICTENQRYDARTNTCAVLHDNEEWSDYHTIKTKCKTGYARDYYDVCRKIKQCSENEYRIDNWTCNEIPFGGIKTSETTWACKDGYTENYDGTCIEVLDNCPNNEVFTSYERLSCKTIPENSHKINNFVWACNRGFHQSKYYEECIADPTLLDKIVENSEFNKHFNFSVSIGGTDSVSIVNLNASFEFDYEYSYFSIGARFGLITGANIYDPRHNEHIVQDETGIWKFEFVTGIPVYIQSSKFDETRYGLVVEPFWKTHLLHTSSVYDDVDFETHNFAFGLKAGIKFMRYHMFTISREQQVINTIGNKSWQTLIEYTVSI